MRVIIAIISFLKQMWWPVLIAGRLWSVQQHRQNKKISKTAQTRIYGWTKHRRSFNIRDVAHVEYLYAIPKKMPMTQSSWAFLMWHSLQLVCVFFLVVKPPPLFSQWG